MSSTPAQSNPQGNGACTPDPDVAASEQGRGYLSAVQAAEPTWDRVTASIELENGIIHRNDMIDQAAGDRIFLAKLKQISFTGPAAAPASALEHEGSTYIDQLDQAIAQPDRYSDAQAQAFAQTDEYRAEASGPLRQVLGLPDSNCTVLRP